MSVFINVKSILIELLVINAIISAILVIISKNPVISVIFLISLVLNSALYLIVKGMPFLGISYILVYLGAIIVLFLFVIMMINIKLTDILETGYQYTKNIPLALTVSSLFLYEFFNVLPTYLLQSSTTLYYNKENGSIFISLCSSAAKEFVLTLNTFFQGVFTNAYSLNIIENAYIAPSTIITNNIWAETLINSYTQIVSVAYSLYTYGAFSFLLLGIVLLLAMIAPIYISRPTLKI